MSYKAAYLDGQIARRHDVDLSMSGNLIVLNDQDGNCLSTWVMPDIYPVGQVSPREPLVLTCKAYQNARLYIEDEGTKNWMFNILPGLVRRGEHARETALAWKLSVGLVIVAFFFYFAWPVMVGQLVKTIPADWEIAMFRGGAQQVAKTLGSKNRCIAANGEQVLQRMVERLVGTQSASEINVMVTDGKMVNAFAVPGQEVILFDGLIKKAESANEVVGVLAHELGHVDARHPIQAVVRSAGLNVLLTALSGGQFMEFAGLLAETSYSRDQEHEADLFALERLRENNISTVGLANFFERLDSENHTLERVLQIVSTHPMSQERAEMMKEYSGGGEALSTQEWQDLKGICAEKSSL